MNSQYFYRLEDALRGLATDPATPADPIEAALEASYG